MVRWLAPGSRLKLCVDGATVGVLPFRLRKDFVEAAKRFLFLFALVGVLSLSLRFNSRMPGGFLWRVTRIHYRFLYYVKWTRGVLGKKVLNSNFRFLFND